MNIVLAAIVAASLAIDLNDPAQRAAMPRFDNVSHSVGVEKGLFAQGEWAYRYRITRTWEGNLPRWPSVNLPLAPLSAQGRGRPCHKRKADWEAYDRLVLDVYSPEPDAFNLHGYLVDPKKGEHVKYGYVLPGIGLAEGGYRRMVVKLKELKAKKPPKVPRVLHLFMNEPSCCDLFVSGFNLLRPGEALPPVSEKFLKTRVEPIRLKAEARQRDSAKTSIAAFVDSCRNARQPDAPCWIGKATSMEKIRPRTRFSAAPAGRDGFSLRLARGENEALQVLVLPKTAALKGVRVTSSNLRLGNDVLPSSAVTCSPVGYIRTTRLPPYRSVQNVATNLPGGYWRKPMPQSVGWWPDPILDWMDRVDVGEGDVQSFWVNVKCPEGQKAGTYRGKLIVSGEGGWKSEWPFAVRVYNFAVPKKSPLPMAITFNPALDTHYESDEAKAFAKRVRKDPGSPVNCWEAHEREWGDFLADHYVTMDSLYHAGRRVHWDVLLRLREQGRLGMFNLGYWTYPKAMDEKALAQWAETTERKFRDSYEKAKELGLLDHAYLYGCDEVVPEFFANIRHAIGDLRRRFPGVPLMTTAYDETFGAKEGLIGMDIFTPTTRRFDAVKEKIPAARKNGKQVWWYIACGQQAPYANLFVEGEAIEARQLMGAQTVMYRPDGFLYYQLTIWNSTKPIDGKSAFTDWNPRSWREFHGDGSWLCCGPDGRPVTTVRFENFRDGLEDYAYALEYERVTGRKVDVPASVCRDVAQYSNDPAAYYAWRDSLAEAIEKANGAKSLVEFSGEKMAAWTKHVNQCRDVRLEDGVVKGTVIGRDSQLYAVVRPTLMPKGNHVVYLKVKVPLGGRGQFFWVREGDKSPSEARQKAFVFNGDGAWHTYRIRPGWGGTHPIKQLRLDFPPEFKNGTAFEFAECTIVEEGEAIDVDTKGKIGVAFNLQMPKGVNYCTLNWTTTDEQTGSGSQGFTTATDGEPHNYWFDLRNGTVKSAGHRGAMAWKGRLSSFLVEQVRANRELAVKDFAFLNAKPDLPADPSITSAFPSEAIPRAGRPFPVEVIVRNFGTRKAEHLVFSFDGLPPGVKVLNPEALAPTEALPGSDGTETIGADCRPPLVNERIYRFVLSDLGEGEKNLDLTLKADGVPARRVAIAAKVLPSLHLAKAAYPAEPTPVVTAPYEVGAFLFPGWTTHRWHGVWSHAPWRKPVLGWYDEENPETIDWQIKHLVENGISFVFVDWYWSRGHQHLNHWMKSFREAKFRKHLKWSLMWANHNGKGSHSIADQEKVTKFWVENYFGDPQYQTIDGMPVVSIWSAYGMEQDMAGNGGCKALLDVSQRIAKEAGYKGIYFVAVCGDDESPAVYKKFADQGFRMTCTYKYTGDIPGVPTRSDGSRPYKWLVDTSFGHWQALKKNSVLPFLPSLSTAWDDRPWRGELGWQFRDINPADFKKICAEAKRYSDETGDRLLLMGPLDEWGEGSIGYPNRELGFGMLEAVRDVFGRKPAKGWPVNHAPEDVGLVCPQRENNYNFPNA